VPYLILCFLALIRYSGGWKDRRLEFGKEDGLSTAALVPYIGTHKLASVVSPVDKIKAAWDNAAHATVTGVGLLYITKFKNLEVPINVINLVCSPSVKLRSHILGRYHHRHRHRNSFHH